MTREGLEAAAVQIGDMLSDEVATHSNLFAQLCTEDSLPSGLRAAAMAHALSNLMITFAMALHDNDVEQASAEVARFSEAAGIVAKGMTEPGAFERAGFVAVANGEVESFTPASGETLQ